MLGPGETSTCVTPSGHQTIVLRLTSLDWARVGCLTNPQKTRIDEDNGLLQHSRHHVGHRKWLRWTHLHQLAASVRLHSGQFWKTSNLRAPLPLGNPLVDLPTNL